ncbi:hypothetical protein TNCT_346701 [Trichonephila clavata]|uniref:Uncharacterized protein n=1 Tax=Trichonephila clavata TaxID=2740835 RepID=A0A8X6KAM3_TRICU|nr:hypothetical protein TNCT_346701 [Trichonephila clavata]
MFSELERESHGVTLRLTHGGVSTEVKSSVVADSSENTSRSKRRNCDLQPSGLLCSTYPSIADFLNNEWKHYIKRFRVSIFLKPQGVK